MIAHDQIHNQDDAQHGTEKPDDCRLLKVLFPGLEKSSDNVRLLVSRHLQCDIIHRGQIRTDGKQWNAAHTSDYIQDDQVKDPAHEDGKFTVYIENSS